MERWKIGGDDTATYIDMEYLGYGAGLVLAFFFLGLVLSVVFGMLRRIGYFIFCVGVSWYVLNHLSGSAAYSADFILLPPGIDWGAVCSDIVLLITPLVSFAVVFGVYRIFSKALNYVRGR